MSASVDDLARQYILPHVSTTPLLSSSTTGPATQPDTPLWMQQAALVQPQPPKQPDTGKGGGRGILGSIGHGIGKGLHVADEVLGASQKYLERPLVGAVTKLELSDPVWSVIGPHSNISEEQRQQILAARSFTQAYRERTKHISAAGKLALDVVADPTTWLTVGSVDAITSLPKVAELMNASPEAARIILGARQAIGSFQEAQALPLTAPLRLGKGALTKIMPTALEEAPSSLAAKEIKGAAEGLFDAARQGATTTAEDAGQNILGEQANRGFTFSNLAGSQKTQQVNNVINTLNVSDSMTRQQLLSTMRAPEREAVITAITPADPSATDVVQFFKQAGVLEDNVIAPTHEAAGRLANKVTDLNNVPSTIAGRIKFVTDAAQQGNTARVERIIDNDLTEQARHTLLETVKANPALDPNGDIINHLVSRGEAVPVAGSTTLQRTSKFEKSLKQSLQAGAAQPTSALPQLTADVGQNIDGALQRITRDLGTTIRNIQTPHLDTVSNLLKQAAERNPKHFSTQTLFLNQAIKEPIARAITADTEKEARTYLALALSRMNMQRSAFGVMHPLVLRNWEKFIPSIQTTADTTIPVVVDGVANSVVSDRDMTVLAKMFQNEKVQALQATYEKMHADVADIMKKNALTTFNDQTTAGDLWEALDKGFIADEADRKTVSAFLKKFGMTPEDAEKLSGSKRLNRLAGLTSTDMAKYTVREAYMDKAMESWAREVKKAYGIEDKMKSSLFAGLSWIPRAWREQALVSPRYHLANWMDMLTRGLLYGVNPVRASAGADYQAGAWGISIPQELLLGRANSRNLGEIANLPEFIGQQPNTALGAVPVIGRVAEPVVRLNRALARGSENTVRKWAWNNGSKDFLATFRPEFDGHIRRVLPGSSGIDVIAKLNQTGQAWARNEGIHFSPQQVYDLVLERGGDTAAATELSSIWQQAVQNASHAGTEFANKVQLDFDTAYNIEDKLMLKKWLPFHFFATRNIPFYLETLAAHPEVVNAWQAFQDTSEQDRIEMGLTSRYRNFLPVSGDAFLHTILGPGQIFFNPLATLSFFDQTKQLGQDQSNPSNPEHGFFSRATIGDILDKGGSLGFGVAPWVQIPMSMLGFYGPADEPMPVFRWSSLAEDVTGHDLFGEHIIKSIEDKTREVTTGQQVHTFTGSQMRDNQIVSRLQEQMLETMQANPTMDPATIRDAYIQASKEGPGNSLWDAAAEEVRKDRVHADVRGLIDPLPTKVVQPTRLAIQSDQAQFYGNVPPELQNNQAFMDLLRNNPGSPAAAVQGFQRPRPEPVGTAGTDQANASDEWLNWSGQIWGPGKPAPFGSRPMFETYKNWFFAQPKNSDRSPLAFLHAFATGQ